MPWHSVEDSFRVPRRSTPWSSEDQLAYKPKGVDWSSRSGPSHHRKTGPNGGSCQPSVHVLLPMINTIQGTNNGINDWTVREPMKTLKELDEECPRRCEHHCSVHLGVTGVGAGCSLTPSNVSQSSQHSSAAYSPYTKRRYFQILLTKPNTLETVRRKKVNDRIQVGDKLICIVLPR